MPQLSKVQYNKGMDFDFPALLKSGLSATAYETVMQVKSMAESMRLPLYLVGGVVRDLILGVKSVDLDFVVEGDARVLAKEVAQQLGGELITHDRFQTAMWTPTLNRFSHSIDFVTARSEQYAEPAALPNINPSGLKDDLFRRDFTLNALALRLDDPYFGHLIDQHGGTNDLKNGLIRILHPDSFVDDPTRLWRAVRYEQRFQFEIEPETAATFGAGLAVHHALSPDRVRHELERMLEESEPFQILTRADQLGLLRAIHPALSFKGADLFHAAREQFLAEHADDRPHTLLLLLLATAELSEEDMRGVDTRLRLERKTVREWQWLEDAAIFYSAVDPTVAIEPIDVYELMQGQPSYLIGLLELLLPADAAGRPLLQQYQDKWWVIKPSLNGNDLMKLGIPPGPGLGQILRRLHNAKLKGAVNSIEDEQAFVRAEITNNR